MSIIVSKQPRHKYTYTKINPYVKTEERFEMSAVSKQFAEMFDSTELCGDNMH